MVVLVFLALFALFLAGPHFFVISPARFAPCFRLWIFLVLVCSIYLRFSSDVLAFWGGLSILLVFLALFALFLDFFFVPTMVVLVFLALFALFLAGLQFLLFHRPVSPHVFVYGFFWSAVLCIHLQFSSDFFFSGETFWFFLTFVTFFEKIF